MQGFRYATFCFARNRAAPRQRLCMHNSALGLLRHPCLYSVVPMGLLFVLFHKTFWADGGWWMDGLEGDAPMEFYMEETFITGVPLRSTPACNLSPLRG